MELIYEGKAKQIYATDDENRVIIRYKNSATAGNGLKKGEIPEKGHMNNEITTAIYQYLEKRGVCTHYVETLNETDQLCEKVDIIPLEVIVRNIAAGSFSQRFGVEEGGVFERPIFEICLKDDDLGDPFINDHIAVNLHCATAEQLAEVYAITARVNKLMLEMWDSLGIKLVDFKLEFGTDVNGNILLADEISPDTCRLWDKETNEKLDKDRFRRDMGGVQEAYAEITRRIKELNA